MTSIERASRPPVVKIFHLWIKTQGTAENPEKPIYMGGIMGDNFNDAIKKFVAKRPEADRRYWKFDEEKEVWTYWLSPTFQNEEEAAKAFG